MTRPAERRNRSLRDQAQAWFQALQLQIAGIEGAQAIAALMKDWRRPEDVMRAYPALVPLFLDLAWQARKTPDFEGLFLTDAGAVAESSTEVLALSQKTFDEVIIAHLMGTVRLMCERRQNEWIAVERERRRGALSRVPVVGTILRGLGLLPPPKTPALLMDYPQKGLYEALKPALKRRAQFALVEGLVLLPTRTVALLGPVVDVLDSLAVIRAVADLDRAAVKIAIDMAETFVQAQTKTAGAEKTETDLIAARGRALSGLLSAAGHVLTAGTSDRQLAKAAIAKLAPVVDQETWAMCSDLAAMRRIAECPAAVAAVLGALTSKIGERVSIALSEVADPRIAAFAVQILRDRTGLDTFRCWLEDETYVSAWKQLVQHLDRIPSAAPEGEPLGPNLKAAVKSACDRGVPVFSELMESAPKAA
jgi:hypothetical protein